MGEGVDRLLAELVSFRRSNGAVGPKHPDFKRWVTEVRCLLGRAPKEARRFDQLGLARGGAEMWRRQALTPSALREFRAELDQVEALLRGVGEADGADAPGRTAVQGLGGGQRSRRGPRGSRRLRRRQDTWTRGSHPISRR